MDITLHLSLIIYIYYICNTSFGYYNMMNFKCIILRSFKWTIYILMVLWVYLFIYFLVIFTMIIVLVSEVITVRMTVSTSSFVRFMESKWIQYNTIQYLSLPALYFGLELWRALVTPRAASKLASPFYRPCTEPKVHYHAHTSLRVIPVLSQIQRTHRVNLFSNIILPSTPRSYKWPFTLGISTKPLHTFFFSTCTTCLGITHTHTHTHINWYA